MNERITFISTFDAINLEKIEHYTSRLNDKLCKVPFGKNVNNREQADTLPYHFTLFAWDIKKEKEVIDFLNSITFKPFKILIENIEVINGAENSYELRFCVKKTSELYRIQNNIFSKYSSKYYIPDNFNFHITIHIDKDYKKIQIMKEKLLEDFDPFELEVNILRLYEIYPAKLVKQFNLVINDE